MVTHSGSDFENIYNDYQPKIFRYLSRLTDDREAEDLTQEVFIKANRALETFRGESQISTWLYRIATNTALDRMRARSFRQNTREIGLEDISDSPVGEIWTREESTPIEQSLLEKERFHCFTSFVQKLPVNYRMVILLSEIEEMTCKEMAELLGLSQDVVKIRLHRGRAKLFQELKAHCKPEEWL